MNFATSPEPLDGWLASFRETHLFFPWFVAEDGTGRVRGFAKAGPHKSRGAYAWTADVSVYVDPESHGRGIGGRLYAVLLPTMRAQGYVTLVAGITRPNPASEKLHSRFGFVPCGTFRRVGFKNGAWHDVGYWDLALRDDPSAPAPIRPVSDVLRG